MDLQPKLQQIKLVITDVDGVLTDGSLYYSNQGETEVIKVFHARDGLGIKILQNNDIQVAVISGRDSQALRKRLADLSIQHFKLGKLNKETACYEIMQEVGVKPEEVAFIGDDSIDLPAFKVCEVAVTVADAMPYIKAQADVVLVTNGGKGAFREFADLLLAAQGKVETYQTAEGFLSKAHKMGQ